MRLVIKASPILAVALLPERTSHREPCCRAAGRHGPLVLIRHRGSNYDNRDVSLFPSALSTC